MKRGVRLFYAIFILYNVMKCVILWIRVNEIVYENRKVTEERLKRR